MKVSKVGQIRLSNAKRIKRKKEDFALIPERPRSLLILGDPMGPFQKYAGWDYGTKQVN